MRESKKEHSDEKIDKLIKKLLDLLRVNVISVSAMQIKNTEVIISDKVTNEENSIDFSINSINKNVLKNKKRYSNIVEKKDELLNRYKELLINISKYYDNNIFSENIKILKEELLQLEQNKLLIKLKEDEAKAKEKLDNSDDEIAEKIYTLEEEINKSETKVRRTKTLLKNKIKDKENNLFSAIETKDKELQKEIKGPRVIKNATRFFWGKLNPYKMIEKNVFNSLETRITDYEKEVEDILKKKIKYTDENIIETINGLIEKTRKKLL